jgi:exopolysaccharide biosynthesis polyprenyl glycosylphosphotransferase
MRVNAWRLLCAAIDAGMLTFAAAATRLGHNSETELATWSLVAFVPIGVALLAGFGAYRPRLRLEILEEFRLTAAATAVTAMLTLGLHSFIAGSAVSASEGVRLWVFAMVYVSSARAGLFLAQAQARRRLGAGKPTLVVGAGRIGRLTAERLLERPELGLRPVGFLDKDPIDLPQSRLPVPVLGASWDLDEVVRMYGVEHVVLTFSTAPHHIFLRLLGRCEELGLEVSMVPRLFERLTTRLAVTHVGGLPLLQINPANPRGVQFGLKYAADRVLAGLLLIFLAPMLAGVALAVRLSMGRPVLYRQVRIGRDGRQFEMLKFRSMKGSPESHGEADAEWANAQIGAEHARAGMAEPTDGDRRTPIGQLLRRYSIDELPQLLNVVRGDMSFVGPRPERAHYVSRFEEQIYRYGDRHRVKSGITGWAQVHGLRGKTSLADRVEWDNYYIENWSLWLDVKIVLMTIPALFRLSRLSL